MRIEIRFCNTLAAGHPDGAAFPLVLRGGATLAEALARLKLCPTRLAMALCNGESMHDESGMLDQSRPLCDGDHLVLSSHDPVVQRRRLGRFAPLRQISALLSPLMQTR